VPVGCSSHAAAGDVENLGYNVRDYQAGKADWIGAGLPLDRPQQ
jgi:hypothetical protein